MKLRLTRRKTNTSIDAPRATTSPYIDVESMEEESDFASMLSTTRSTRKSPLSSISGVTSPRKRKMEEEENEEEGEMGEQEKTSSNVKAKKSCCPSSTTSY